MKTRRVLIFLLLNLCVVLICWTYNKRTVKIPFVKSSDTDSVMYENNHNDSVMYENNHNDNIVCKIPKLTLENDKLREKFLKLPPLNCTGDNLMYMSDDGYVSINETVLLGRKINSCKYNIIEFKSDYHYINLTEAIIRKEEPFAIKIDHDFFQVKCQVETASTQIKQEYVQYFAHIGSTEQAVKRIKDKNMKQTTSKEQMNILIFALDSMSHLSYQRKLPKTYNYLKNTLGAVIFNSYNILGYGTLGTMVPLLTGKLEVELPSVRRDNINKLPEYDLEFLSKNISTVDVFPWIWKEYKENGYVTLMAEDAPRKAKWGNFAHKLYGFVQKPTDHYLRTFWLAAEKFWYCCGNRPQHQYQLDYVKHFFKEYEDVPKFAYSFIENLSHNSNNPVQYLDTDLVEFLKSLKDNGKLDNTVLILMGDHGLRFGGMRRTHQGKLEERLPLMSFVFPEWFKEKYPKYYTNLEKNAHKLSTPFDIHETLHDILNLTRLQGYVPESSRGMSLLQEIPVERTCDSADVNTHWCTCINQLDVNKKHQHITKVANIMVDHIKSFISDHLDKCANLNLKEVNDAKLIIKDEQLINELQRLDPNQRMNDYTKRKFRIETYQIILTTSPSNGMYEGTLQYRSRTKRWSVIGELSRVNMYGNQPWCIEETHPDLVMYCYCRKQKIKTINQD